MQAWRPVVCLLILAVVLRVGFCLAATRNLRDMMSASAPVPFPTARLDPQVDNSGAGVPSLSNNEFDYSRPECTCTDPDIFTGYQYCFNLDKQTGKATTDCHYCETADFADEMCREAAALDGATHNSTFTACTEILQLPSGLSLSQYSGRIQGVGLKCINTLFFPVPFSPLPEVTPGAPPCSCFDAGEVYGLTGAAVCFSVLNNSIPDSDCQPPAEYTTCSVYIPVQSYGNLTDGSARLCKSNGSSNGSSAPPLAVDPLPVYYLAGR